MSSMEMSILKVKSNTCIRYSNNCNKTATMKKVTNLQIPERLKQSGACEGKSKLFCSFDLHFFLQLCVKREFSILTVIRDVYSQHGVAIDYAEYIIIERILTNELGSISINELHWRRRCSRIDVEHAYGTFTIGETYHERREVIAVDIFLEEADGGAVEIKW